MAVAAAVPIIPFLLLFPFHLWQWDENGSSSADALMVAVAFDTPRIFRSDAKLPAYALSCALSSLFVIKQFLSPGPPCFFRLPDSTLLCISGARCVIREALCTICIRFTRKDV